jgi:NAD(P)-dependent dehydrogenase (short-subunit alcohol dehydrogenase family)
METVRPPENGMPKKLDGKVAVITGATSGMALGAAKLYASAGVGEFNVPLGAITEASFDNTFNVNVRGTLFAGQRRCRSCRTVAQSS